MRNLKITAIALVLLSVANFPTIHPSHVSATPAPGLYQVTVTEGNGPSFGCIGAMCPTEKRKVMAFNVQARYAELAGASKIVTVYPLNGYDRRSGCAIISGTLKCFGANNYGRLGNESREATTDAFVTATDNGQPMTEVFDVAVSRNTTCVIQRKAIRCIGRDELTPSPESGLQPTSPPSWITIDSPEARKIRIFEQSKPPGSADPRGQIPLICALFSSSKVGCTWLSTTPTWRFLDIEGITDFDPGKADLTNYAQFCVAGVRSGCATIRYGSFENWRDVPSAHGAERVYYEGNVVVFYKGGALFAAPHRAEGVQDAHLVGYMPQPLALLWKPLIDGTPINEQVLVMPNGFLTVPTTALSCDNCFTNGQGAFSPLTTFTTSGRSTFNAIVAVNGSTDSLDYVPMTVESGSRSSELTRNLTLRTASGDPIANAIVTWRSTDVATGLATQIESAISNQNGQFRVSAFSGPVTFSIVGGSLPSGATLQGAFVTLQYSSNGTQDVVVPDPDRLVDRKVTVVDAAGSPIPNAKIILRNSYLAYSYSFRGADTATWGAQPPDPRGFLLEPSCIWCYVPPPAFITGVDGTVTFRSFGAVSRSAPYDLDVSYDDGILAKSVEFTFTTIGDTVVLPIMPTLVLQTSNPSSAGTIIEANASDSGLVVVELSTSQVPPGIQLSAKVEDVCEEMETGALWSSTLTVNHLCTSTKPPLTKSAKRCGPDQTASVSSGRQSILTLCAVKSRLVRLRAKGAVAGRAICIVVNGVSCPRHSTIIGGQPRTKMAKKIVRRNSRIALSRLVPASAGTIASYSTSRPCIVNKGVLTTPAKPGVCTITQREIAIGRSLKGKSAVKQIVIVIR